MKILFVNPLDRSTDVPRDVPFDLLSLSTIADRLGHKVDLLDLNAFRETATLLGIKGVMKEDQWDLIWATCRFSSFKDLHEALPVIRKEQPTAVLAVGGSAPTTIPQQFLDFCPDVDIAVLGDQEETFEAVLEKVPSQRWTSIQGVAFRYSVEGEVTLNPPREKVADLDALPLLNYSFVPLERYFQFSPQTYSAEAMQAKRRLSFSFEREYKEEGDGKRLIRMVSPARAVASITATRFKYAIDFASIVDFDISTNLPWFKDFVDRYLDEGLHEIVSWGCVLDPRIAASEPELVRSMKDAGCKYVLFRFKEPDMPLWQASVDAVKKHGVAVHIDMPIGHVAESPADLAARSYFLFKNDLDANVAPLVPYPDTPYYTPNLQQIMKSYSALTDEEALRSFLTDVGRVKSVNISPLDDVDLMGYGVLVKAKEYVKILKVIHGRGEEHDVSLRPVCPVCKVEAAR